MLLNDYVVADREPEPGAFAGWLGGEERVEYFVPDLCRDAGAVVADSNLHLLAQATCGCRQSRLEAVASLVPAPGCGIEPIRDQVQEHASDLLWEHVDLA